MKARDVISPRALASATLPSRNVEADMSLPDVLPRLLDTDGCRLGVTDGKELLGVIDAVSLLQGFSRLISPRDDSSTITIRLTPSAYSASQIAHAVEDADVHLVDLWSSPGDGDLLIVTLRVRTTDPSAVVSSLERYGYEVVEALGDEDKNLDLAMERLLSLKTLLEV